MVFGTLLQTVLTVFGKQGKAGRIVHTGGYRYAGFQCRALGLIFHASRFLSVGTGADKVQAGLFHRFNHLGIFRHEAVARENGVVTIILGYTNDLLDTLAALFLVGTGIIRHPVNAVRVGQTAQFRRKCVGVGNGVFLRQQNAVTVDTHFIEDIHGFLANGAATDDQWFQVFTGEAAHPHRR